eukprot:TRINITY_DN4600_c0_g3_i1.p1 TRINITY_DN4600_c0_g3~~TRINITY_DN4600_c0_g3_i1.p1  ORF type:complete len:132 (-),score=32.36 TRINITY_DN4600_c0_g3_i1:60-455(-)
MKGSKAIEAMPKSTIAKTVAEEHELKIPACSKITDSLSAIAAVEVKKTGKLIFPGVAMLEASQHCCEGMSCVCHQEVHLEHSWYSGCSKVNQAAMCQRLLLAVGDLRKKQGSQSGFISFKSLGILASLSAP